MEKEQNKLAFRLDNPKKRSANFKRQIHSCSMALHTMREIGLPSRWFMCSASLLTFLGLRLLTARTSSTFSITREPKWSSLLRARNKRTSSPKHHICRKDADVIDSFLGALFCFIITYILLSFCREQSFLCHLILFSLLSV